jgi:hypothetical protein
MARSVANAALQRARGTMRSFAYNLTNRAAGHAEQPLWRYLGGQDESPIAYMAAALILGCCS